MREGALDLAVTPIARSEGVGTALADAAVPLTATAWSHGDHPAAARLAAVHGFDRARELWVMRRRSSVPLADIVVPSDVGLRHYQHEDEAELLRVNAAAFSSHPEQGAMDARELAERMAEDWFDAAGLLVAVNAGSGRMLGFHWTKRPRPRLGEVYVLAIDPDAQGRGLGRLLTLAGLVHLADTDEVELYVEADNAPAHALYAGLGFTHALADTHAQYRRARS